MSILKRFPTRFLLEVEGFSTSLLWKSRSQYHDGREPQPMKEMRDDLKKMIAEQQQQLSKYSLREWRDRTPLSQDDLPVKTMKDSYLEGVIPLKSHPETRLRYTRAGDGNFVRIGRILEDLDTFAVASSYLHNRINSSCASEAEKLLIPRANVTALVDRIDINAGKSPSISSEEDIKITGNVAWVGRSSMAVNMKVLQCQGKSSDWDTIINAVFLMVSRNPVIGNASVVCPLVAETDTEKKILERGKALAERRTAVIKESLLVTPPTEAERHLIHKMFVDTLDINQYSFKARVKPANSVWMEDSMLKSIFICHPEERNLYNKIFGGYLMRQAYELAWSNSVLYSGRKCEMVAVDDIMFKKPVEIGMFLLMSSEVTYTEDHLAQVRVHAEGRCRDSAEHSTSNVYHFTFSTIDKQPMPRVIPKTYSDSMLYLDGKRRFDEARSVSDVDWYGIE